MTLSNREINKAMGGPRLRRPLVCPLGGLSTPYDKVAFLKTSSMNHAAMIVAQGMLIACNTRSSPETVRLEKHNVVTPVLILRYSS